MPASSEFPRGPGLSRLLLVTLVDRVGSGMFVPIVVVYLCTSVGLSLGQVGSALTLAGLVATLAPLASGALLRRVDARWVVVGCFLAAAVALGVYARAHSLLGVCVAASLLSVATRMERPGTQVMVMRLTPDPIGALAWHQRVTNVGYGVGAVVAAGVLSLHSGTAVRVTVLADAVTFLAGAAVVLTLPAMSPQPPPSSSVGPARRAAVPRRSRVSLYAVHSVLAVHDSLLLVAVPAWIVASGAPSALNPILFGLNTLLVATLQVRGSRWFARHARGPAFLLLGAALAVACATFAVGTHLSGVWVVAALVAVVAFVTLGEIGHSASEGWLGVMLSRDLHSGTVMGSLKTGMSVQQAAGPLLAIVLVTSGGPWGWLLLGGILVAASALSRRLAAGPSFDDRPAPVPDVESREGVAA
ncbi:MAG: MFS transporter [Nocardioides sp.]